MAFGYMYMVLIPQFVDMSAAASAAVDASGRNVKTGSAGMIRREYEARQQEAQQKEVQQNEPPQRAQQNEAEQKKTTMPSSLFEVDGQEWSASMDHVPISTYFSFAEYGQRYMEARDRNKVGGVKRKKPAEAMQEHDQNKMRLFVRSLLEQAEDFEAEKMFGARGWQQSKPASAAKEEEQNKDPPTAFSTFLEEQERQEKQSKYKKSKAADPSEAKIPSWFNGGVSPQAAAVTFEYQSAIGRDGFEPDPLEPLCEYFGPFKLNYETHTIYVDNWNLVLGTELKRYGMGNLIVGNNQSYEMARNGLIVGRSNILRGSYGAVGGEDNFARGRGAVVAGGLGNSARADYSTAAGGAHTNATIHFAVAEGGLWNGASAPFSTVGGGRYNNADGFSSDVMGGTFNYAMANLSAITGGYLGVVKEEDVSDSVQGGSRNSVAKPEKPKVLREQAGEQPRQRSQARQEAGQEIDMAAAASQEAADNEHEINDPTQDEPDEEVVDEEENAATRGDTVTIQSVDANGDNRRRVAVNNSNEEPPVYTAPQPNALPYH